ncbi:MAG: hypothetical protein AB8G86_26490, partial [Saprospiraceae bacterium]
MRLRPIIYNLSGVIKLASLLALLSFSLQSKAQQDLSITQISDVDSAGVGDTVTFTITLMNDGTMAATGVTVTDTLPPNMTYISHNALQGTFDPVTKIWIAGPVGDSSIAIGATHTLEIAARLEASGVHTNHAQVFTMNDFDIDSAPNDNVVTDDDYATACVSVPFKICTTFKDTIVLTAPDGYGSYQWTKDGIDIPLATDQEYKAYEAGDYTFNALKNMTTCRDSTCCPIQIEEACFDLALAKKLATGQMSTVTPGDDVTFTITIYNQGDFYADSILITDSLPTGLTNNSGIWIGNDTLLTIADGGLVAGGLAPNASVSIDITLNVDTPSSLDSLVNYAEISSAADVGQIDDRDIDSTPDAILLNDAGGGSNTAADDVITGTGLGAVGDGIAATDEDDNDPEVIYLCPSITNPIAAQNICSGSMVDSLGVETTYSEASGISFVYFMSAQTGTNMYDNGMATTIGTVTATDGVASVKNIAFPANMTGSSVTYYVYAIISPTPDMGGCRPFQEIQVTVDDQPEAGNQASALTICESSTTSITLADELTGEDTGGTWTAGGSNPSGGTFAAGAGTFDPTGA